MHTQASLTRIAFIGNYAPRRCGIATFTHDLHHAISMANPALETCIVAMTDDGRTYDYPEMAESRFTMRRSMNISGRPRS